MRKRQFGKGRKIYASEHNLTQDYIEQNIREISMDGSIRGIITGGTFIPHTTLEHTIILQELVARSYRGERITVEAPTNIFMKPPVDPGVGNEVWVTAYVEYNYQQGEYDTDSDGIGYYKDYQNSFTILTTQGAVASSGNATKTDVPSTSGILLCDILYDANLYSTGLIQSSDIDTDRQDRFDSQALINLTVIGDAIIHGTTDLLSDLDLNNNSIIGLKVPTTDEEVGNRGYNDARYVNTAGDTMTGTLNVPNIVVSSDMTIEDLFVNGSLEVDENVVVTDSLTVEEGTFAVNKGDASIGSASGGGDLVVYDTLTAKALVFPWGAGRYYEIGQVVYYEEGIYKCTTTHTSTIFVNDISYWESIGGGGGTTHRVTMTAHGFIVGDSLRYDSNVNPSGGYVKALADDVDTLGQFVVIRVLDADNFIVSSGGYFEDATYTVNFTPNTWYYTSDTSTGKLTPNEPQISNPMLYAITANEAFVFAHRPNVGATFHIDEFVASIGQTVFTLSKTPLHQDYLIISVDGVIQSKSAYTFFGTTLTFLSPLSGGEEVRAQIIHNTFAHPGASMIRDEFLVTSTGETEFILSEEPISDAYLVVSIDGIIQHSDAYTVLGNVLTFNEGLYINNAVRVQQVRNLNLVELADYTVPIMDIYKVSTTVDRDVLLASNGLSSGPITINNNRTIEIPDGYTWTII